MSPIKKKETNQQIIEIKVNLLLEFLMSFGAI
jgi:hypothetical protein